MQPVELMLSDMNKKDIGNNSSSRAQSWIGKSMGFVRLLSIQ